MHQIVIRVPGDRIDEHLSSARLHLMGLRDSDAPLADDDIMELRGNILAGYLAPEIAWLEEHAVSCQISTTTDEMTFVFSFQQEPDAESFHRAFSDEALPLFESVAAARLVH
jgi:hypothetical protein